MRLQFTTSQLLEEINKTSPENFSSLEAALEKMETTTEDRIKVILNGLGITNSQKVDRKSLPARFSIKRDKNFSEYFENLYDVKVLKRMFLRDLLSRGQCKIRFFVEIVPKYKGDNITHLEYSVNWFEHERQ